MTDSSIRNPLRNDFLKEQRAFLANLPKYDRKHTSIDHSHAEVYADRLWLANRLWCREPLAGTDVKIGDTFDASPGAALHEADAEILRTLLNEPFFLRLAHCLQLGTVASTAHAGASHTRLAHAIGTFHTTAGYIDAVQRNAKIKTPPAARVAALIYAFAHDSVATPFGHSLDLTKDLLILPGEKWEVLARNRKLDKVLLHETLEQGVKPESSPFWSAVTRVIERVAAGRPKKEGLSPNVVREWLAWLVQPTIEALQVSTKTDHFYLRQILDSDLDADRMDWLRRDALNLSHDGKMPSVEGVDAPVDLCVVSVMESATCANVQINAVGVGVTAAVLRYVPTCKVAGRAVKTVVVMEALLKLRVTLYQGVYELPRKLAVDEMVAHSLRHWLLESGIGQLRTSARRPAWKSVRDGLACLTDSQLIDFILTTGFPHAARLVADAMGGRHFVQLGSFPQLDAKEAGNVLKTFKAKTGSLKQMIATRHSQILANEGNRRKLTVEEKGAVATAWLDSVGLAKSAAKVWTLFLRLGSHDLNRKYELESKIWTKLTADADFRKTWNVYLQARFGIVDEKDWTNGADAAFLESQPHVFLGLPFYTGRQVELMPRVPEDEAKDVQALHTAVTTDGATPNKPDPNVPSAHFYGPPELKASVKCIEAIVTEAILDSPAWIVDEVDDAVLQRATV